MELRIQTLDTGDRQQLLLCFPAFAVLRPHLDEEQFVQRVGRQVAQGYRIVYIQANGRGVTNCTWIEVVTRSNAPSRPRPHRPSRSR